MPTPKSVALPKGVRIPEAAWSRPIGLPVKAPPKPSTDYPMIDDGPYQGAPLGGIGAGTIGRTFRGDFARWHLDIGKHHYETVPADMFSIYMEQNAKKVVQTLWTGAPKTFLQSWNWKYPVGAGNYYALYPRAWFVYDWSEFPARVAVEQFSPIIPDNYRESSYPVAVFVWTVENPTASPVRVGIMFTWQNMVGRWWGKDFVGGHVNRSKIQSLPSGQMKGLVMDAGDAPAVEGWQGSFAIASVETEGVRVSYYGRFRANGDGSGIWSDFSTDGVLSNLDDPSPSKMGEVTAGGVAATVDLAPGEVRRIPFVLAWDFPIAQFGDGSRWYRRYTAFFGTSGYNVWRIAREALEKYPEWMKQIEAWQAEFLREDTPLWYKRALLNELYFVADGGTAWVTNLVQTGAPRENELGHFAELECYDYPFYETLDVRFYGSFPLLMLWPKLEKRVMEDYIQTVGESDLSKRKILGTGQECIRKAAGAVPHDLGMPKESPFLKVNAYDFQDINIWKDLNSKYVLLLYRDYLETGDRSLLDAGWPSVKLAMEYLKRFDRDGDGLPENDGVPDQTYDTWAMKGPSAYCSGLWIAGLEAAVAMAGLEGDLPAAEKFKAWLELARDSFEEKLWNGRYYNYDTGSAHRDSLMADQLAGHWYAELCSLPDVVPPKRVRKILDLIYRANVLGFSQGMMGAVNGTRSDGSVDKSSDQSQEVWVGVTYAIASHMLRQGLDEEAWKTAWGAYHQTYEANALWFRTPEAWTQDGRFRASMYMRPGAIWAMEYVLRKRWEGKSRLLQAGTPAEDACRKQRSLAK